MKYVISLMEETGSREDWQPKLQIPIDLPEPFAGWEEQAAFEQAVEKQLAEHGVTRPYGSFYLHITEAVPELASPTPDAIAAVIAAEYPRLARDNAWDDED